eukprot:TRINITY_DN17852_c0_g1_i1.p1 TRINITY_DN17852_c0_g1~~TRINITY_DN17852_c0_g1_i1.p1  ORF type:complete len:415 (+),score=91.01 TRINITY_DN17852_c0_g1_i1:383-1627(+)
MIIGTKSDLPNCVIAQGEAVALASSLGCRYMECSAKTGDDVDNIFFVMADIIIQQQGIVPISTKHGSLSAPRQPVKKIQIPPQERAVAFLRNLSSNLAEIVGNFQGKDEDFSQQRVESVLTIASYPKTESEFQNEICSKIEIQFHPEGKAQAIRDLFRLSPGTDKTILAFSCFVKEDANLFAVGELSGRVKDMLSLAQTEFEYKVYSRMSKHPSGRNLFNLSISLRDNRFVTVQKFFEIIQPKRIRGTLEFDQAPPSAGKEQKSEEETPLGLKLNVDVDVAPAALRLIEQFLALLGADSESVLLGALQKAQSKFEFEPKELRALIAKNLGISEGIDFLDWMAVSKFAKDNVQPALSGADTPLQVRGVYASFMQSLSGIASAHIVLGDQVVDLQAEHLDFFHLLAVELDNEDDNF